MHRLTGDYTSAAASAGQALALFRDHNHLPGQAWALYHLGATQQETEAYPAAAASLQQALALFRDVEDRGGQAATLRQLGLVMQSAGDYPAATASHQQALKLFRDLGARRSQAETLNSLGELSSQASNTRQARDYQTQALPSPATSVPRSSKPALSKDSARPTFKTANPAKPLSTYAKRSVVTSASEAPAPSASRKPCGNMSSNQHLHPATNKKSVAMPPRLGSRASAVAAMIRSGIEGARCWPRSASRVSTSTARSSIVRVRYSTGIAASGGFLSPARNSGPDRAE